MPPGAGKRCTATGVSEEKAKMPIIDVERLDLRPIAWAALCPECMAKILVICSHGQLIIQEPHCRHMFDPQKTNGSIHVAFQRDVD